MSSTVNFAPPAVSLKQTTTLVMPSKRKPLPITPALISISHDGEVISIMSQLNDKGRLFVICPSCQKHVQLSRYGHSSNFKEHYKSKICNELLDRRHRRECKEILVKKFGPMYGV